MDEIQQFLINLFLLESEAINARRDPDIEVFNAKFDELMSHVNHPTVGFEMSRMDKPLSGIKFRMLQKAPDAIPRHIFKISRYVHADYPEMYAAYVSSRRPQSNVLTYGSCYFVGLVNDKFKILSQYVFGDPDLVKSTWRFTGGDRAINFTSLGKPIEVLRLLEPKDDPDSVKDYLRNK